MNNEKKEYDERTEKFQYMNKLLSELIKQWNNKYPKNKSWKYILFNTVKWD